MRILPIILIASVGAGPASAQVRTLEVGGTPLLEIGVMEGEEPYQLYGAVSSTRRSDGGLVLLNAGTGELRYFNAEGQFLRMAGGRGEGPGEFLTAVRLYPQNADSLLVFDRASQRLSQFDSEGEFVRSLPFELTGEPTFPLDTWLHGRYWVEGPVDQAAREAVKRALDLLPPVPREELFRYVHVDRWGRSWIRGPVASGGDRAWLVHDVDGSRLVQVRTDATFEIHEVGPDYLLGRARLDLDVEVVRVHNLDLDPGGREAFHTSPPLSGPSAESAMETTVVVPPETMAAVRSTLRVMMGAMEGFYANHGSYAGPGDELVFETPEAIQIRIVHGDPWGWAGAVIDVESDVMCGVGIGLYVPPGWREGRVLCSR